jgi:hypothetical protein
VNSRILYENLDTSFVNLWALLRFLMQRGVVGRVHVELPDYTADVFLNGSSTPMVHEVDQATGRDSLEEAALHRLVVRAREPGGTITVYEGEAEAAKGGAQKPTPESATVPDGFAAPAVYEVNAVDETVDARPVTLPSPPILESAASKMITAIQKGSPAKAGDWLALVGISGELIAAIESAATGVGADFAAVFNATRLELADDYTFLDPSANRFAYADRVVKISAKPGAGPYVAAIGELLRRVVDKIAVGERGGRIRERVALELAKLARKRREPLTQFNLDMQLDRIAGTRVL